MCVCRCVGACAHVCICACVHMRICAYICACDMRVEVRGCMCTCVYICVCAYAYMCMCAYVHMHMCVCRCVGACVHVGKHLNHITQGVPRALTSPRGYPAHSHPFLRNPRMCWPNFPWPAHTPGVQTDKCVGDKEVRTHDRALPEAHMTERYPRRT